MPTAESRYPVARWRGPHGPISAWGQNASVELSWHVGFTPDFGRMVATQRTGAAGHEPTFPVTQGPLNYVTAAVFAIVRDDLVRVTAAQGFIGPIEHAGKEDCLSQSLAMSFCTFGRVEYYEGFRTGQPIIEQLALHRGDAVRFVVAHQRRAGDPLGVARVRVGSHHLQVLADSGGSVGRHARQEQPPMPFLEEQILKGCIRCRRVVFQLPQ
jgi:hypothetical protein